MEFCALILLECPRKINLHVDNLSLKTGSLFKGIKGIPIGAHYVYYNLDQGVKSGFCFYAERGKIVIKQWDDINEDFINVTTEDQDLFEHNYDEFDPLLVEYPQEKYQLWNSLAIYIKKDVISKLEPVKNIIYSADKEYETSDESCENFSSLKGSLFYTTIPKSYMRANMTSQEITRINFDKSFILYNLLSQDFPNPEDLLGELQFAFIAFVFGDSLESFEQWKRILILICNCEDALWKLPDFFEKFIPVFYTQVQSISQDLLSDPLIGSNFLLSCIRSFLALIHNKSLAGSLYQRGKRLKRLLKTNLGISEFEMCEDEEAPVIVEI